MRVIIRSYKKTDFEACKSLHSELTEHHREIYEDPTIGGENPSWWLEGLIKRPDLKGLWVAEINNNVVGFTGLFINGDLGEIEPVVVTKDLRHNGIGQKLVQRATMTAKEAHIRFLSVKPVARNVNAIGFFTILGFNKIGGIELFRDLLESSDKKWKTGIVIHNKRLKY